MRILNYSYLKIIASLLYSSHLILSDYLLAVSWFSFGADVFVPFLTVVQRLRWSGGFFTHFSVGVPVLT